MWPWGPTWTLCGFSGIASYGAGDPQYYWRGPQFTHHFKSRRFGRCLSVLKSHSWDSGNPMGCQGTQVSYLLTWHYPPCCTNTAFHVILFLLAFYPPCLAKLFAERRVICNNGSFTSALWFWLNSGGLWKAQLEVAEERKKRVSCENKWGGVCCLHPVSFLASPNALMSLVISPPLLEGDKQGPPPLPRRWAAAQPGHFTMLMLFLGVGVNHCLSFIPLTSDPW